MRRPGAIGLLLVLASASASSLPAGAAPSSRGGGEAAEVVSARQHFRAGEKAFNAGDYTRALLEFEAGYVLVPRPGFLLNMAHTERRLGHAPRARELYQRYLDADPESKQRDEVLGLIADIDRSLYAGGRGEAVPPAMPGAGTGTFANQDAEPSEPPPVSEPVEEAVPTTPPASPVAAPLPRAAPPAEEPAPLVSTRRRSDDAADEPGERPPLYKSWWFWAAMGVVAVGATTAIVLGTRPSGATFQDDGSLGRAGTP